MKQVKNAVGTTVRRRFRLRHLVLGVLVFITLGGLWAAYRLTTGPIHVPVLAQFMADKASTGPARLTIADALIDLSSGTGMQIVVRDAHLSVAGEVPVDVILPRVEAPVDLSALLDGEIHFSSLSLDRPSVTIGVRQSDRELPGMHQLVEAVDRVSGLVEAEFERRNLSNVDIQNGAVEINGAVTRSFKGIDAEITRAADRSIRADANVAGRVGPWTLELLRNKVSGGEDTRIALLIRDVTLAELLDPQLVPRQGKGLGLPLEAKFEARLSDEGKFRSANLVGRVVNGWFQMGRTSVRVDDAAVSLAWLGDDPAIQVTKSHMIRGNTRIFFSGNITPPQIRGEDWNIALSTDRAQFGPSDIKAPPSVLDAVDVDLRFTPANRTLFIDRMGIQAGNAKAYLVGSVQLRSDGPYLALAIEGEAVPVAIAKQVWPITLIPPARRWIVERLKGGLIETVRADIAVRPPAFDHTDPDPGWSGNEVTADVRFSKGRLAPVGNVPEIYGLSGTLEVKDETLIVRATDGLSQVAGGTPVDLPGGTFQILRLRERDGKLGVLDVTLAGGANEIGQILNSDPFHVLDKAQLPADALSGEGSVRIQAEFPLRRKISVADVDWQAEATSDDITLKKPVRGHTIRDAALTLTADPDQVVIKGKGVLDGLPADIDLLFPLGGSDIAARKGVVLNASAEQLKQRGIDLTAFLDGPMTLNVDDAGKDKVFDVDLTKTVVRLDALGWQKAKGVPARASFRLVENDDSRQIEDFSLTSDGVDVSGSLTLTSAGELRSASFAKFQLRGGDEASISIQRSGNGRYKVAMVGTSFDARGLIRQIRKPSTENADGSFSDGLSITANLTRVTGFKGSRLDGFTGNIETDASGVTAADLTGKLNGRAPFTFTMIPEGTGRAVNGNFGDAGAMLRFLDLYERMRGGDGKLVATMHDSTTWDGTFGVKRLSITDDAAIKSLSSRTDLLATRDQGARVLASGAEQSGEASFETLELDFTRAGDVLTITRGALQGAVFGGTVSGTVNMDSETMDMTGTFVPIYALNNIFAKIPLLGFALGGGAGEGLIGVTYKLSGQVADPVLSVNPISAIAPGIFRKMFEFQ